MHLKKFSKFQRVTLAIKLWLMTRSTNKTEDYCSHFLFLSLSLSLSLFPGNESTSFKIIFWFWWGLALSTKVIGTFAREIVLLRQHKLTTREVDVPNLKNGPFPVSFFFILVFSIQLTENKKWMMTGSQPWLSGVRHNYSTNWATTTTALN